MEAKQLVLDLTQTARGLGGDKYECPIEGKKRPQVLYFDQSISRPRGEPEQKLMVTVTYQNKDDTKE